MLSLIPFFENANEIRETEKPAISLAGGGEEK